MSAGWKTDCLREEKILQEETKPRLIQDKDKSLLEGNSCEIPLNLITQKDQENAFAVKDTCLDSPNTEARGFRESIQNKANIPQVHKFESKKNKLVKQQTLSDLPEDTPEENKLIKGLRKQNTISGAITSEGKFSPCSVSSDGDRLFIRVRGITGVDLLSKCNTVYTSARSLESSSDKDAGSSGVGTSLVSLSGLGTSSAENTTERPASIASYRPRSGADFWSQVAQQVAFIDSTGHSNRSSLLLNCGHQIPPGVSLNTFFYIS